MAEMCRLQIGHVPGLPEITDLVMQDTPAYLLSGLDHGSSLKPPTVVPAGAKATEAQAKSSQLLEVPQELRHSRRCKPLPLRQLASSERDIGQRAGQTHRFRFEVAEAFLSPEEPRSPPSPCPVPKRELRHRCGPKWHECVCHSPRFQQGRAQPDFAHVRELLKLNETAPARRRCPHSELRCFCIALLVAVSSLMASLVLMHDFTKAVDKRPTSADLLATLSAAREHLHRRGNHLRAHLLESLPVVGNSSADWRAMSLEANAWQSRGPMLEAADGGAKSSTTCSLPPEMTTGHCRCSCGATALDSDGTGVHWDLLMANLAFLALHLLWALRNVACCRRQNHRSVNVTPTSSSAEGPSMPVAAPFSPGHRPSPELKHGKEPTRSPDTTCSDSSTLPVREGTLWYDVTTTDNPSDFTLTSEQDTLEDDDVWDLDWQTFLHGLPPQHFGGTAQ